MVQQSSPAKVCMEGIGGSSEPPAVCTVLQCMALVGWGPPGEDCKGADDKEYLLF